MLSMHTQTNKYSGFFINEIDCYIIFLLKILLQKREKKFQCQNVLFFNETYVIGETRNEKYF